jgi:hypothetical protein
MAYATATDVAVRWARTPTAEESALIEVRLADVERMILRKIPTLVAKVSAGTILLADLKQVESDAVLRLVRNPDGYLSESDGNYTYMLKSELASGRLEILPEEWEILGVIRSRISFIDPFAVLGT